MSTVKPSGELALAGEELAWLRNLIEQRLGFPFPDHRLEDLYRSLREMAAAEQINDVAQMVKWLLYRATPEQQLALMARYITIGETYFFRDEKQFDLVAKQLVPPLLHSGKRPLMLWSAGCSSGEEPYTLAIALFLQGLRENEVQIVASDINPDALQRARVGCYTSWSFRHALPDIQQRFFQRTANQLWQINDTIRQRVNFFSLNLVEDSYPAPFDQPASMAVIFCRNVLMYFSPEQRQRIVGQFVDRLMEGGWLLVSPSEAALIRHPQLHLRDSRQANLFYRNSLSTVVTSKRSATATLPPPLPSPPRRPLASRHRQPMQGLPASSGGDPVLLEAEQLFYAHRLSEAAVVLERQGEDPPPSLARIVLLARIQANLGRLNAAERNYRQAILRDRLQAEHYYHLAMILLAKGETEEAQSVLEQALFLQPDLVIAHLQLATLCRDKKRARKHASTVWQLLEESAAETTVPYAEGMTVQTIRQIIRQLDGTLHA
ncbi:MAG: hypothetical protein HQM06_02580 [Magnetococcales bacterium]|nr:hypothetical protein [Magnetococcales bacterium]